jgi:hypothetical protein
MSQENIPALQSPLEIVQYQFEKWRESRKSLREPIPESLWAEAINLCNQYSINLVCRTLHLSYTTLKRRIQGLIPFSRKKKISSPSFFELDWSSGFAASECMIEMENAHGSRMRMSFKGQADLDLLELSKAFWARGK